MAFDFSAELEKITADMSLEDAKELAVKFQASIEARDNDRICACGTPCRDYHSHNAADRLALIAVDKVILRYARNAQDNIIRKRKEIESHKKEIQAQLMLVDNQLRELQAKCLHPDKKSQPEYDFTAHWCDDCGLHWSTRR